MFGLFSAQWFSGANVKLKGHRPILAEIEKNTAATRDRTGDL